MAKASWALPYLLSLNTRDLGFPSKFGFLLVRDSPISDAISVYSLDAIKDCLTEHRRRPYHHRCAISKVPATSRFNYTHITLNEYWGTIEKRVFRFPRQSAWATMVIDHLNQAHLKLNVELFSEPVLLLQPCLLACADKGVILSASGDYCRVFPTCFRMQRLLLENVFWPSPSWRLVWAD